MENAEKIYKCVDKNKPKPDSGKREISSMTLSVCEVLEISREALVEKVGKNKSLLERALLRCKVRPGYQR